MPMDAQTHDLVERLVAALQPLTKSGWNQRERDAADDLQASPVTITHGQYRANNALLAEAQAALDVAK